MEVHPPEHGIHSWRDFFVHMGTICLGLLIALALEQGAEALHRRHEAKDLREDLRGEQEQILVDGDESQKYVSLHMTWLAGQRRKVLAAVWDHEAMSAASLPRLGASWGYPDDPIYRTAQANGRTSVLSSAELYAYSDIAADVQWGIEYEQALEVAADKRIAFERSLPVLPAKVAEDAPLVDFARLSIEELKKYLELLSSEQAAARRFRVNCLLTRGLAEAVLHGARDPKQLSAAEEEGVRKGGPSPD